MPAQHKPCGILEGFSGEVFRAIQKIAETSCHSCESRPGFLNASLVTCFVEDTEVFYNVVSLLKVLLKALMIEFRLQCYEGK